MKVGEPPSRRTRLAAPADGQLVEAVAPTNLIGGVAQTGSGPGLCARCHAALLLGLGALFGALLEATAGLDHGL